MAPAEIIEYVDLGEVDVDITRLDDGELSELIGCLLADYDVMSLYVAWDEDLQTESLVLAVAEGSLDGRQGPDPQDPRP